MLQHFRKEYESHWCGSMNGFISNFIPCNLVGQENALRRTPTGGVLLLLHRHWLQGITRQVILVHTQKTISIVIPQSLAFGVF